MNCKVGGITSKHIPVPQVTHPIQNTYEAQDSLKERQGWVYTDHASRVGEIPVQLRSWVRLANAKRIERILVPLAGVEADKLALRLACETARLNKSQIYVIHVMEVKRSLPIDAEIGSQADRGEEILEEALEIGRLAKVSIRSELLQARQEGPAIVDEAVGRAVDTIIFGFPYERKYGEFSMGDAASYVLKNAPCEVWLCRADIS